MLPPEHPDGPFTSQKLRIAATACVLTKEPVMPVNDMSSRRRFVPLATAALFTVVFSSSFALIDAHAQSVTNNGAKNPNPTNGFKVPPLPAGSANVQLKPGMSEKDWHDAYKETGRPKFHRNTVKHVGDTVERD
jgi:hypothetical protein